MSAELKPCPFCGSAETLVADLAGWESFCKTCGTNGPALNTEREKVVADWNRRPPASSERVALSDEYVAKVVRSVQPHLSVDSKAWRDQMGECFYWLETAQKIDKDAS